MASYRSRSVREDDRTPITHFSASKNIKGLAIGITLGTNSGKEVKVFSIIKASTYTYN